MILTFALFISNNGLCPSLNMGFDFACFCHFFSNLLAVFSITFCTIVLCFYMGVCVFCDVFINLLNKLVHKPCWLATGAQALLRQRRALFFVTKFFVFKHYDPL